MLTGPPEEAEPPAVECVVLVRVVGAGLDGPELPPALCDPLAPVVTTPLPVPPAADVAACDPLAPVLTAPAADVAACDPLAPVCTPLVPCPPDLATDPAPPDAAAARPAWG